MPLCIWQNFAITVVEIQSSFIEVKYVSSEHILKLPWIDGIPSPQFRNLYANRLYSLKEKVDICIRDVDSRLNTPDTEKFKTFCKKEYKKNLQRAYLFLNFI